MNCEKCRWYRTIYNTKGIGNWYVYGRCLMGGCDERKMSRMDDLISKLSEIRSEYNCFNQDEEPYYRALSEVISILSRRADGDTISRQAAIDVFRKELCREREYATPFISFKGCERILNELPSAERRGRWIENETSYADHPTKQTCNCSVCKRASTRPLGDWCRWCGSRMDLDGDTE